MSEIGRRAVATGLLGGVFAGSAARGQPAGDASAILRAADRIRYPQQPFRASTTLTEYVNGRARETLSLTVYSRVDPATGESATLIRYVSPARDAGKLVLFAGVNLWFYDPASRASVRISPQQRLIGQAANGDVVTTNLSRDYAATLAGSETVADSQRVERACFRLDLSARTSAAVYRRSEIWIERTTSRPVKARFYADSGRLLKTAYYAKLQSALGAERPMQTIIIDAVDSRLVTTISVDGLVAQDVPAEWFRREYLARVPAR